MRRKTSPRHARTRATPFRSRRSRIWSRTRSCVDCYEVARHYIIYRYVQSLKRQKNTTDDKILSLIECNNEEVKQENSNKNPTVNSVQRDYMAGEISKDLTQRVLLPRRSWMPTMRA